MTDRLSIPPQTLPDSPESLHKARHKGNNTVVIVNWDVAGSQSGAIEYSARSHLYDAVPGVGLFRATTESKLGLVAREKRVLNNHRVE